MMKDTQVQKLRSDARRKLAAGEVSLEEVKSLWLDEERAAAENREIGWTDQRIANILAYAIAIAGPQINRQLNQRESDGAEIDDRLRSNSKILDRAIEIAHGKIRDLETALFAGENESFDFY